MGSRGPGHKGQKLKPPGLPPSTSNASPSSFAFSQRGVILFLFPFIGAIFSISATHPLHPSIPGQSEPIFGLLLQAPLSNQRLGGLPHLKGSVPLKTYRRTCLVDKDFPPVSQEERSNPKQGKMANWQTSMKSSRLDAFCQDSDLIKEARVCYFATHPWDWTQRNTNDLSDISRGLATKCWPTRQVHF